MLCLITGITAGLTLFAHPSLDDNRILIPEKSHLDSAGRRLVGITANSSTRMDATVWDFKTGSVVLRVDGHQESVVRVELSRDGREVMTSSYLPLGELMIRSKDDSIRIWNLETGKQRIRIDNATHGQFSRDGKRIFGFARRVGRPEGSNACDVVAWDARTGKNLFTIELPSDQVAPQYSYTLQEAAKAPRLLFQQGRAAAVYNSVTGMRIGQPVELSLPAYGAFISPNGNEAQFAELNGVSYYVTGKEKETNRIAFPKNSSYRVEWKRNGRGFVAVSVTGLVLSYDREMDRLVSAQSAVKFPQNLLTPPEGSCFFINWVGENEPLGQITAFDAQCNTL